MNRYDDIIRILNGDSSAVEKQPPPKSKNPTNEFKVRWQFKNLLTDSTFKITKKFWVDIEWCYKIQYESGTEHVFTESHFKHLIGQGRFKRVAEDHKEREHFDDGSLFRL